MTGKEEGDPMPDQEKLQNEKEEPRTLTLEERWQMDEEMQKVHYFYACKVLEQFQKQSVIKSKVSRSWKC